MLYQCSFSLIADAFSQTLSVLLARYIGECISRVLHGNMAFDQISIALALLTSIKGCSARENLKGFLLLADISCDHLLKVLFKL